MERHKDASDAQIRPIAGIWACDNCGRRIQVITDSVRTPLQPFICVCGVRMTPNEEHAEVPQADDEGLPGRPPLRDSER